MPLQRINLLPPEERRKASRERGLMYALLFLIFVVAVLGVLYVFENQRLTTRHQDVASLQSDLDVVNAQIAQLKPFETLQSQRATMTQWASQIVDSRIVWSSIFEEISLLIPDTVSLNSLAAAAPATMLAGGQLSGAAGSGHDVLGHGPLAEGCGRLHDPARPDAAAHEHQTGVRPEGGRRRRRVQRKRV